ncbi:MAG: tRNA pseudouridine(55) synthase TruB [Kiritimatiellae bacterium]|nr:tRNA pseudouridine(55) synthase TruB [Kiritimatiellia bacterium]
MPSPQPLPTAADPDGVLLVNKPRGWTSHDVVAAVRRRFRLRKVGHGGTLDPMATGLLVLLIGRATRLAERFMSADKAYAGTFRLGVETDTEDADGRVIAERDPGGVTEAAVRAALARRTGDLWQTPPMISAIKHAGQPLYKLARRGTVIERRPRLIHIYEFSLVEFVPPRVRFYLRCTKGTYVRTLCADVGRELGCGAYLEELTRTQSGELTVEAAAPLDDILAGDRVALEARLLRLDAFAPAP